MSGFFGFDTTMPGKDKVKYPKNTNKKQGQFQTRGFENKLFEEDKCNDETFGGSLDDLNKDYDFASNNLSFMQSARPQGKVNYPPGFQKESNSGLKDRSFGHLPNTGSIDHSFGNLSASESHNLLPNPQAEISLDDLFGAPQQAPIVAGRPKSNSTVRSQPPGFQPISLLDQAFESMLLDHSPHPNQRGQIPPMSFSAPKPSIDWEKIRLDRKRAREERRAKMVKYDGFMCQGDKDFITQIQLSQLVSASDSLSVDNFYFDMYKSMQAPLPHLPHMGMNRIGSEGHRLSDPMAPNSGKDGKPRKDNEMTRMQKQLSRIVADTKRRQKTPHAGLENVLGKIPQKSARNPKKVLQVSHQRSISDLNAQADSVPSSPQPPNSSGSQTSGPYRPMLMSQTPLEKKKTLKVIESMFDYILDAERLAKTRPLVQYGTNEERERLERWAQQFEIVCVKLWDIFGISDNRNPSSIIHLLNCAKGKKMMSRYGRFMSRDHALNFISVLLAHLESLNVIKHGVIPAKGKLSPLVSDEIELFLATVLPPILAYINEAPLVIVNGLLSLLIEKNNVVMISRTKVGLAFLTLFLTRSEVLRQSGGALIGLMAPSPEIPLNQSTELFKTMFMSLQNHFQAIFPPATAQVDDLYAWQFLASLAIGLKLDMQHQLVLELREKVIDHIANATRKHHLPEVVQTKIANVNLFLHALGLDASQVNIQSTR